MTIFWPTGPYPDAGEQADPVAVKDCEFPFGNGDSLAGEVSLSWHAEIPIGDLEGAEVDASVLRARVSALALIEQGISGRIPPELCSILVLKELDLSHHEFIGEIPTTLGTLSMLVSLQIG
ncbi:MAG: hypothetical protein OXH98_05875 [Caldilineaceae bacterium]|nr:hypothetical protein [Caldilineaceae bacterium]